MKTSTLAPLIPALLAAFLVGCDEEQVKVEVEQPISFSHKAHLSYFESGRHRDEKVKMHLENLGLDEAPEELTRGECAACHDTLSDKPACASCHETLEDQKTRDRQAVRACLGCHSGAWKGNIAGIPTASVCASCHAEKALTATAEEKKLREVLASGKDLPWTQINTLPNHVYFSHPAHVRYGGMDCKRCHGDVAGRTTPPDTVTVFSMDGCLKCHETKHATKDCVACHK